MMRSPMNQLSAAHVMHDEFLSHMFLHALMTQEPDVLREQIIKIDRAGLWPNDVRQDLQGLYAYRSFYNKERMAGYDERRKQAIREYDWKWTLELAYRLYGYIPTDLIGQEPLPPELSHLQTASPQNHQPELDPE